MFSLALNAVQSPALVLQYNKLNANGGERSQQIYLLGTSTRFHVDSLDTC